MGTQAKADATPKLRKQTAGGLSANQIFPSHCADARPTLVIQRFQHRPCNRRGGPHEKEGLEALFADGENMPDLGPIEDHLHTVATEWKLPDFAIAMCTLRIEESAPKLRASS